MPCQDPFNEQRVSVDQLCAACKLLTRAQLIEANLFNWYKSHLLFDFDMGIDDKIDIRKECDRVGLRIVTHDNRNNIIDIYEELRMA